MTSLRNWAKVIVPKTPLRSIASATTSGCFSAVANVFGNGVSTRVVNPIAPHTPTRAKAKPPSVAARRPLGVAAERLPSRERLSPATRTPPIAAKLVTIHLAVSRISLLADASPAS